MSDIQPLQATLCSICGDALPGGRLVEESRACSRCQEERPKFDRAFAYSEYEGVLRGLIHLLKYDGVRPASRPLGVSLARAVQAQASLFDEPVLVIPVPLHRSRLRTRGFNQAEQIARAAMRVLPRLPLELGIGVLNRVRATDSQTGFTREQRRKNLRAAFAVTDAARVRGRSVLLVDDVLTTGATADECARVLRRSGAQAVWVATAARAVSYQDASHDGGALCELETASG